MRRPAAHLIITSICGAATAAFFIISAGSSATVAQSPANPASAGYAKLDTATSVIVVKFSQLNATATMGDNIFGSEDDDDLALLRARVAANPMAMGALNSVGSSPDDVIALSAVGNGAVTLFVNDL